VSTPPASAASSYKDTLNLLETPFSMRANAKKREPELQAFWREIGLYERLSDENPGPVFTLHDGPPYANGALHVGHALNKILKDIINKHALLRGHRARFVPGWDCHGLPIELKVLQTLAPKDRQALTPLELRRRAHAYALEQVDLQRRGFQRWGIWGDWDRPYLTLDKRYEAAQIAVFGRMALAGHIYRGLKPVHWSPSSRTALAEASTPRWAGAAWRCWSGAIVQRLNPAKNPPGAGGSEAKGRGARFAAGTSATHALGRSGLNADPQPAAHTEARHGADERERSRHGAGGSRRLELGQGKSLWIVWG
jgi:hypothetical protein